MDGGAATEGRPYNYSPGKIVGVALGGHPIVEIINSRLEVTNCGLQKVRRIPNHENARHEREISSCNEGN